jgi:hypothetical protein
VRVLGRLAAAVVCVTTAAVAVPAAATGAPRFRRLGHPPARHMRYGAAVNWAGYAAQGSPGTYHSVSSTWTQPAISCSPSESSAAAFWTGLDGLGSSTVEQTGTVAQCSHGTVAYLAFYELFPKRAFQIPQTPRPGDVITGTVTANARKSFTLTLHDATAGWNFTTTKKLGGAQLVSAEAIAEAAFVPGHGIEPLSNFGTVSYSGTTANGQVISGFNPEMLTMVTSDGSTVRAAPSPLSGGNFSVTWQHS